MYRVHKNAQERILYSKLSTRENITVRIYGYSLTQLFCRTLGDRWVLRLWFWRSVRVLFRRYNDKGVTKLVSSNTKVLTSPFYFIKKFSIILTDTLNRIFPTFLQLQILQITLMWCALWKNKNAGMFLILVIILYLSLYDIMLTKCVSPAPTIAPFDRFWRNYFSNIVPSEATTTPYFFKFLHLNPIIRISRRRKISYWIYGNSAAFLFSCEVKTWKFDVRTVHY
jgi:hypothetical protein